MSINCAKNDTKEVNTESDNHEWQYFWFNNFQTSQCLSDCLDT